MYGHNLISKIVSFSGITPLHIAMMNDDKPCVDALLRHGADPKMLVRFFILFFEFKDQYSNFFDGRKLVW